MVFGSILYDARSIWRRTHARKGGRSGEHHDNLGFTIVVDVPKSAGGIAIRAPVIATIIPLGDQDFAASPVPTDPPKHAKLVFCAIIIIEGCNDIGDVVFIDEAIILCCFDYTIFYVIETWESEAAVVRVNGY